MQTNDEIENKIKENKKEKKGMESQTGLKASFFFFVRLKAVFPLLKRHSGTLS